MAGRLLAATANDAPPDSIDADRPPPAARHSPVPSEPRPLGAAFDSDDAMSKSAPAVASYALRGRLDADAHEVEGRGTIRFVNASSKALEDLRIHLYLNAFKNTRSLFLRSPFGRSRSGQTTVDWGYIDIRRLTAAELGPEDLWKRAEFTEPADDETDARVPLPRPLEPGQTLTLSVEWTSRLPGIVERTGHVGSFHLVAQWFPKLAGLDPNGTWIHFPFHAHSEFFSDFGEYDVTLDVPSSMIVGATGQRLESHEANGRRTERYGASNVHDFAWTAWDGFIERDLEVDGVAVRLLGPRGHEANLEATARAVEHGLPLFGRLFGRYPYRTLTVVHPPQKARAAGGMEYPTLITTGGAWYAGRVSTFIERVTLHELGHQWFYGLVATDEHSFPFLDEGLTSFAESIAMKRMFGDASGLTLAGLTVNGDAYMRAAAAAAGHRDVVARPAAAFATFSDLSSLVYARTATILATLAGVWGEDAVLAAIGRYARGYRFGHPTPRHLVAAIRERVGEEAASVLSRALFEGGWVDFVAKEVASVPVVDASGVFDGPNGRRTTPEPSPTQRWRSRVLVYRHGTLELPVDVDLVFEDGARTRRRWEGRGRWTTLEHVGERRVVAASVDPDLRIPLDQNLLDNAIAEKPGETRRLLERLTYAGEVAIGALGP
jgi:hypothetical protein